MRQAIVRLLWFPAIAGNVSESERAGLNESPEPGVELLCELLDNLRASPAQSAAQVVERWADKPDGEHFEKLLQREALVGDAAAATSELKAALVKLAAMAAEHRLEALEAKSRIARLSPEEMVEFQRLMTRKTRSGGA